MRAVVITIALLHGYAAPTLAECPAADREAMRWLDRMSHSLRETSYRGVFTYQHGGAVQAMRISHSVSGNMEREEITHLTGKDLRVVRTEHPLDCIHPGHKLVRLGSNFQGSGDDCGLSAHYRLKVAGGHRIAGRSAVIINVIPRDSYRFGYQMAVDRGTGLLLKTQTVAKDGRILERFQFADLEIGDVDMEGTEVDVIRHAPHDHGVLRPPPDPDAMAWNVGWLPAGFTLTDDIANTGHDKSFTDGLAIFSVFVERVPEMESPGEGVARQGGTNAYTRGRSLSGQPVLITVLGEVPMTTARRVADSVSWAQ